MTAAYNALLYFDDPVDAKRACGDLRGVGYRVVTQDLTPDIDEWQFCVEAWIDEVPVDANPDAVNAMIELEVVPITARHDGFLYEWGVVT
jgi:hypothetical protein